MDQKELEAFAREAAKGMKTEKDLSDFSRMLTKITVEAALNGELDEHLGYEKHDKSGSVANRVLERNSLVGNSVKMVSANPSTGLRAGWPPGNIPRQ